MPEVTRVHRCPTCGRPVRDDEDFVLAQEYELNPGFSESDHVQLAALPEGRVERFHTEHFYGRIGLRVYELVSEDQVLKPDGNLAELGT